MLAKVLKAVVCLCAASTSVFAQPSLRGAPRYPQNVRGSCAAWSDSFASGRLDPIRWVIGTGSSPGGNSTNIATYDTGNVQVTPGVLRLALTQLAGTVNGKAGVLSYGGMVRTNQLCGYGTYSWTMKMSSTALCADSSCVGQAVSGGVSAGFIYINNSQTEIDFEFQGQDGRSVHLVNWLNLDPSNDPIDSEKTSTQYSSINPIDGQHTYTFTWTRGKISYYVDGKWIVDHTTNVPTAPAYFRINHWGTNSTGWGGLATTGVTRYLYVTHASYSPLTSR